jgi:hypothetical protein
MSLLVFNLGSKFEKVAEIYGGNFDPEIIDLDRDGIPEIRVTDDFLAYRFSSFAYSATADVILKYANGRCSVASELLDRAWLADVAGKSDFLKSNQEALSDSRYYTEFETEKL